MVNFAFNIASLMGIGSIALAVALPILALTNQPIENSRVIQSLVLAPFYLSAGVILVIYGWRFDPIMQFSQMFLVGLNAYWVLRDLYR